MTVMLCNITMSGDKPASVQVQVYQPDADAKTGARLVQCTELAPDGTQLLDVPPGGQIVIIDAQSAGYE